MWTTSGVLRGTIKLVAIALCRKVGLSVQGGFLRLATTTYLNTTRREKRQKTGWTLDEIRARAAQERAEYQKLVQSEPDDLVSGGDMKKFLEESGDE